MTNSKLAAVTALQFKARLNTISFTIHCVKTKIIHEIRTAKGRTFWLWCQITNADAKIVSMATLDKRIPLIGNKSWQNLDGTTQPDVNKLNRFVSRGRMWCSL